MNSILILVSVLRHTENSPAQSAWIRRTFILDFISTEAIILKKISSDSLLFYKSSVVAKRRFPTVIDIKYAVFPNLTSNIGPTMSQCIIFSSESGTNVP